MNRAFVLPRRRKRLRPYLDLTAMIDTVFNLLIFFAVIASFAGDSTRGIPMNLPSAKTSSPVTDRVVLTLLPGQPPQVNNREVAMDNIPEAIRKITGGNLDTQIVVMADKKVVYSELVSALDRVRGAGFHRIALATAPPQLDNGKAP